MKPYLVNVGRKSDENVSEWRLQDRGGNSGKPSQNKDSANWRQENEDRGVRQKWGCQDEIERRGEKWNSHGDDEQRGKSWKDSSGSAVW
jgi:hypothetical protein